MKKGLVLTLLALSNWFAIAAIAQQDNTAFYRARLDTLPEEQITLRTHVFGYFKSNEYFNKIVEGYTLPGYQLWPSVHYRAQKHLSVEAGLWAQKDFGSPGLRAVEPTLTLSLHDEHRRFNFGTLEGTVEHGLLEPLMNFEQVMERRLENGMQVILDYDRARLDVWTDWMKYIFPGDSTQEEFTGGITGHYYLLKDERVALRLPATVMFFHRGGQIDADPNPVFTMTHFAGGLEGTWTYPGQFIEELQLSGHYLYYLEWNNPVNVYPNGQAWYANASIKTHLGTIMASYWRGTQWLTAIGGRLYRSQSSDFDRPDYTEPTRELLIFRIMNEFHIGEDYRIMLRTEPHFDLGNQRFEYALGTYVFFDPYFVLGKTNRR